MCWQVGASGPGADRKPEKAVTVLERGRALMLSEALRRDVADLHRLTDVGRGNLTRRYRSSADRLGQLETATSDVVTLV